MTFFGPQHKYQNFHRIAALSMIKESKLEFFVQTFPPLLRILVQISMSFHVVSDMPWSKHVDIVCNTFFSCTW